MSMEFKKRKIWISFKTLFFVIDNLSNVKNQPLVALNVFWGNLTVVNSVFFFTYKLFVSPTVEFFILFLYIRLLLFECFAMGWLYGLIFYQFVNLKIFTYSTK